MSANDCCVRTAPYLGIDTGHGRRRRLVWRRWKRNNASYDAGEHPLPFLIDPFRPGGSERPYRLVDGEVVSG